MNELFIKLNDFLKLFLFKQKRQKLGGESLKSYNRTDKGLLSLLWQAYLQMIKDHIHTFLNTDAEMSKELKQNSKYLINIQRKINSPI